MGPGGGGTRVTALRRLWPFIRPHFWVVLLSIVQVALVAVLRVLQPPIVGWVIDRALWAGNWNYLVPGALLILGIALVQGILRFGQRYTIELMANRVIYEIRGRLYHHVHGLSFGFFDQSRTGELMSRLTADVETLRQALGMGIVNGIQNLGTVVGVVVLMFVTNWRLAIVSLLFLPLLLRTLNTFTRVVRPTYDHIQEELAGLTAVAQESIQGVRVIRAFAREDEEIRKFMAQNQRFQARSLHSVRLMSYYNNYMNFLTALGLVGVLWYGGQQVVAGHLTPGQLVEFNLYLGLLSDPVRMLSWIASVFARAATGSRRIFELLDRQSDVQVKPGARTLPRVKGHICFEGVDFTYESGTAPVLADINLEIKPGQKVAVLGLTGSGKSTLAHLVPRFYDPTAGRITLDGMDIRDVTLESLRRQIAVVMQETFLFSATLKENIAYGKPSATMSEIMAAARAAQIHDFIAGLPKGYDTLVGERGVGLSGGQKQRIAIARALLTNTPVVILDESTASVDVQTEQRIHAAMDRVMQGRTAIIIAQRLSTIQGADLVLVLDGGRVVQQGTHADLQTQGGLYRTIHDLQFRTVTAGSAGRSPASGEAVSARPREVTG